MERRRTGSPVYLRQGSGGSSSTGSSSPAMSPAHHRSASVSGISGVRRTQNVAARAAAARLAQVMASQSAAGDEDEDDDGEIPVAGAGFRYSVPTRPSPAASSNGNVGGAGASLLGRATRSPSPAVGTLWSKLQQFALHQQEDLQFQYVQHRWCLQVERH